MYLTGGVINEAGNAMLGIFLFLTSYLKHTDEGGGGHIKKEDKNFTPMRS